MAFIEMIPRQSQHQKYPQLHMVVNALVHFNSVPQQTEDPTQMLKSCGPLFLAALCLFLVLRHPCSDDVSPARPQKTKG